MIRLTVEEVPDKYTAYFISKYGIKQEQLELVKDGHVFKIVGQARSIISKFRIFRIFRIFQKKKPVCPIKLGLCDALLHMLSLVLD